MSIYMKLELLEIDSRQTSKDKKIQIFVDPNGKLIGKIFHQGETIQAHIKGEGIPSSIPPDKIDLFKKYLKEHAYYTTLFDDIFINCRIEGGVWDQLTQFVVDNAEPIGVVVVGTVSGIAGWVLRGQSNAPPPKEEVSMAESTATATQKIAEAAEKLSEAKTALTTTLNQQNKIDKLRGEVATLESKIQGMEDVHKKEIEVLEAQHTATDKKMIDDVLLDKAAQKSQLEQKIKILERKPDSKEYVLASLFQLINKYPLQVGGCVLITIGLAVYMGRQFYLSRMENNKLKEKLNQLIQKDINALVVMTNSRVKNDEQWETEFRPLWTLNRGISASEEDSYWSVEGTKAAYQPTVRKEDISTDDAGWKAGRSTRSTKRTYIMPRIKGDPSKGFVFIKTLPMLDHPKKREEYQREIEILTRTHSPWIVSCLGYFQEEIEQITYHCLVMELAICSLDLLLTKKLPARITYQVVLEIIEGLCFLHAQTQDRPIAHRDLKPHNILMGKDYHFRIADFGLSKKYSDAELNPASHSNNVGTVEYAAPEAIVQSLEPVKTGVKSDIYSFGLIIWSLLMDRLLTLSDRQKSVDGEISDKEADIISMVLQTELQSSNSHTTENSSLLLDLFKNCCKYNAQERTTTAPEIKGTLIKLNQDNPLQAEDLKKLVDLAPGVVVNQSHYTSTLGFS